MRRALTRFAKALSMHGLQPTMMLQLMIRTIICCFTVLTLITPAMALEKNSCPNSPHTLYSRRAASLDSDVRIVSPDGRKTLVTKTVPTPEDPDEFEIDYTVTFAEKTFTARLPGFNGEVAWSPDSKAFAVTQTEGGGGLGSRVYVFYVDYDQMTELDVSLPIEKDFGTPVKCDIPISPNTGFISWKTDSSVLLVAAEVVPVSVCECSGTYRVYEMDLPTLKIAKKYSQTEAKSQFWDLLGCELRDADESCVKDLERKETSR